MNKVDFRLYIITDRKKTKGRPLEDVIQDAIQLLLESSSPVHLSEIHSELKPLFEKIEANISLKITPWVSASGEVTTEIHPEFNTPVGSLDPNTPPTIDSRVLDSTVRLNDGETIILGGLIRDSRSTTYNKVPLLGDLPYLGHIFRNRNHNDQKEELIIYITPHIFYGDERDNEKWQNLKNDYKEGYN